MYSPHKSHNFCSVQAELSFKWQWHTLFPVLWWHLESSFASVWHHKFWQPVWIAIIIWMCGSSDWLTATCWRNLVPTFVDRGVSRCQRSGSPTVVNLNFPVQFARGLRATEFVFWFLCGSSKQVCSTYGGLLTSFNWLEPLLPVRAIFVKCSVNTRKLACTRYGY
jgi:hypothetical protein